MPLIGPLMQTKNFHSQFFNGSISYKMFLFKYLLHYY